MFLRAILLIGALAAGPAAWASDREICAFPEPANHLLATKPAELVAACTRLAQAGNAGAQYT
ncbi:MAG: hypothetical protein U1E53_34525, partial [Dongiaceae bacterium]